MDIERWIKVEENKNDKGEIYYTAYSPQIMKDIVGGGKTPKEAIVEMLNNLRVAIDYLEIQNKD